MAAPVSSRVVRGAPTAPYQFAVIEPSAAAPPRPASEFVAWGTPGDDGSTARDAAVQEAYQRGVEAGRAEAEAAAASEIDALRAAATEAEAAHAGAIDALESRTREAALRLSAEWGQAVRALEPRLVDFALGVVGEVLGAPPHEDARQAAVRAISEAVDRLADGNPTTISLHPVDLLQHQESGFARTLEGAHPLLRWEPDNALAPGDWVVSTPEAAVRRVATEALASLRDRLGLGSL